MKVRSRTEFAGVRNVLAKPSALGHEADIIFIGGAPRSGTTLLQDIFTYDRNFDGIVQENWDVLDIVEMISAVLARNGTGKSNFLPSPIVAHEWARDTLETYLRVRRLQVGSRRIIVKVPALTPYFPLVSNILGRRAAFVVTTRNSIDSVASFVRWKHKLDKLPGKNRFADFSAEDYVNFLGSFYTRASMYDYKGAVHWVRHEDIILNYSAVLTGLERIYAVDVAGRSIDSKWNFSNLYGTRDVATSPTFSKHYGKPISKRVINSWRGTISPTVAAQILFGARLFDYLAGYDFSNHSGILAELQPEQRAAYNDFWSPRLDTAGVQHRWPARRGLRTNVEAFYAARQ